MRRSAGAVVAGALALLAAACAERSIGPPQSGPTVRTEAGVARPYGHGASAVWVLTPSVRAPRSVVVFIHGWTATSPFEWHEVWLDHLLRRGSAVVFPVYQAAGDESELVTSVLDLRSGLQAGFRALDRPDLPVVVAGYSVGGALAFYYAADAPGWGVPSPRAAYSIFPIDPGSMDPGLVRLGPPPPIPVVIMAADRDAVVGTVGARVFLRWSASQPAGLRTYRFLRSDPRGLFFDHESPTDVFLPAMRRVFWAPLDRLVERAVENR